MNDAFEPRNELEFQLLAAQEGKLAPRAFMRQLLDAQVFVPVEEPLAFDGIQSSERARPLIVSSDEGSQVLVVFTSPERAKPFVADLPAYRGGILAEFRWVVERLGPGLDVALNPGWSVGMDLEAETIERLERSPDGRDG